MDLALLKSFENELRQEVPDLQIKFKEESRTQKLLGFLIRPFNPTYMTRYVSTFGSTVYFPTREGYESDPARSFGVMAHEFVHIWDSKRDPWFKLKYMMPQALGMLPILAYGLLAGLHAWILLVPLLGYLFGCLLVNHSKVVFWTVLVGSLAATLWLGGLLTGWYLLILLGLGILAPWPAHWRVKYELAGYGMNMAIVQWRSASTPPPTFLRDLTRYFTGPGYYFMSWSGGDVERSLEATRQQAQMGVLQKMAPYSIVYDFLFRAGHLPRTSLRP